MKVSIRFCGVLLWAILAVVSCKKERSCEGCLPGNPSGAPGQQPPIAVAGRDTTTLQDHVLLDGSASTDSDGRITAYQWIRLDGPSSFQLVQADAAKTEVRALVPGTYRFELTVTDNDALTGKDTVQVTVGTSAPANNCGQSNRPLVNTVLTPVGHLSRTRSEIAVAAVRDKVLFAGGYISGGVSTSRIDILDTDSRVWTTAELSEGRSGAAVAVLGDKVFFAGGYINGRGSSRVDIYDAATETWSTAELSEGRAMITGAAVGNKVLFAGGVTRNWVYSYTVDIYDATTGRWSVASLSERSNTGTVGMVATVVGDKVYFAGEASEWLDWSGGSISSTINVYDAAANSWFTTNLGQARGFLAGIAVGSKNYWAGGVYQQLPNAFSDMVEIRDMATGEAYLACLFQPNAFFQAVQHGSRIIFFTGAGTQKNKFDIYDTVTDTWSIGVLTMDIEGAFIVSAAGTLYVAGGAVNGTSSTQVWKLEF